MINPINAEFGSPVHTNPDTYGFISSKDLIERMLAHGWRVDFTQVARVRKTEREGYQKHLIRFVNDSLPSIPGLTSDNASRVTLNVINSHDGTNAFHFILGCMRIVCLNGLMAGTALDTVRVVHSGKLIQRLDDAVERSVANVPTLIDNVVSLQSKSFTEQAERELIKRLFDARLKNVKGLVSVDYTAPVLRRADMLKDGFTVLNRVQERLIRGGIKYRSLVETKDAASHLVSHYRVINGTTRAIRSIPQTVALNKLAYDTAMELAA